MAIITDTPVITLDDSAGLSVKERLQAVPLTLTKLNIVKRDVRTIDEILADRDKARLAARGGVKKVIEGDDAKEFGDWFAKKKKSPAPGIGKTPGASETSSARASPAAVAAPSLSASTSAGSSSSSSSKAPAAPIKPVKPRPTQVTVVPSNKPNMSPIATGMKYQQLQQQRKRTRSRSFSDDDGEDEEEERSSKRRNTTARASSAPRSYLPEDVYSLVTVDVRGRILAEVASCPVMKRVIWKLALWSLLEKRI